LILQERSACNTWKMGIRY